VAAPLNASSNARLSARAASGLPARPGMCRQPASTTSRSDSKRMMNGFPSAGQRDRRTHHKPVEILFGETDQQILRANA